MKTLSHILLLLTIILGLCSCATKMPFTSQTKEKYGLSSEDLSHIQFYISDDLTLTSNKEYNEAKTKNGKLIGKHHSETNTILIKKNTKGSVIELLGDNLIKVSFEDSGDNGVVFGLKNNSGESGEYKLMAKHWEHNRAKIQYSGDEYWTDSHAQMLRLNIKLKSLYRTSYKSKTANGRKFSK